MNGRERGAILVTFAISALALLLFFGLAIDTGFLYMSRAALSKGADAAALTGVRNLGFGQAEARRMAESAFHINYAASGLPLRQVDEPQVAVSFVLDEDNNTRVTVSARVEVSTFFLRLLPDWSTISVTAQAQAARARLIMALALDRSGSMRSNGGAAALPGAVADFIELFDDASDRAALSSYADHATLDVSMRFNFTAAIRNRVNSMSFNGWTYSHGGIDIGRTQINGVITPPNENVLRALVFFTDGHANSFLSNPPGVRCTSSTTRMLVLVPDSGNDGFRNPANGSTVDCTHSASDRFFSIKYNANRNRTANNVQEEGLFMAERSAQLVRQNGILVFAIGLGTDINQASLRKMANDPASADFQPDEPEGLAVFAPTPAELDDVFRQIAAKILLRLTR